MVESRSVEVTALSVVGAKRCGSFWSLNCCRKFDKNPAENAAFYFGQIFVARHFYLSHQLVGFLFNDNIDIERTYTFSYRNTKLQFEWRSVSPKI